MRASRLLVIPALLATVGCMQGQRLIKVNADGSGTIVDTVKLGEQARSMSRRGAASEASRDAQAQRGPRRVMAAGHHARRPAA